MADAKLRIRDYHPTDLPYLYDICLRTGDSGVDASGLYSDPFMLGQYFAAPYAIRAPRCVLLLAGDGPVSVAAGPAGDRASTGERSEGPSLRALGYVLGTDDTASYDRWMEEAWLPALRALYPSPGRSPSNAGIGWSRMSAPERWLRDLFDRKPEAAPWVAEYPGHLHIDILPEAQGSGWGRALMDAFRLRLSELGCPAFHLGVSRANGPALRFYRRYGLRELAGDEHTLYLGMETV